MVKVKGDLATLRHLSVPNPKIILYVAAGSEVVKAWIRDFDYLWEFDPKPSLDSFVATFPQATVVKDYKVV